jgi:hypothetical protein
MKRIILIFLLSFLGVDIINAQSPDMFTYQAVARDDQGNVLSGQDVGIKVSILQGSANGTVVYEEEHSKTTTAQGLVNLMIGDGSVLSGTFSNIDWSSGPYFLKVGMDETGGADYSTMGTSQLLSVPYAKYADNAGNTFSGSYNDLMNTPDFTDWDQNVNDDFSGNYENLSNRPWKRKTDTLYHENKKVAIGTDSLTHPITIEGSGPGVTMMIRDNFPFISLNALNNTNAGYYVSFENDVKGSLWYNASSDNIILQRSNNLGNDITISPDRNVGINNSNPQEQLDINGAIRVQDTTVNPEPGRVYANSTPIAYGDISSSGSIISGSYGIASVNRVATGDYDITLRNGVSEYATVSITTYDSGSPEIATYESSYNTDQITVHIWDMTSSKINSRFSIVVYGLPEGAKQKDKKSEMNLNNNLIDGS